MKAFIIYYEPWDEKLQLLENVIVAAEDIGKAKVYFRKYFDGRIIKVEPIK